MICKNDGEEMLHVVCCFRKAFWCFGKTRGEVFIMLALIDSPGRFCNTITRENSKKRQYTVGDISSLCCTCDVSSHLIVYCKILSFLMFSLNRRGVQCSCAHYVVLDETYPFAGDVPPV